MEHLVPTRARHYRRVTFIAPQDRGKTDPFAPAGFSAMEPSPETPTEVDSSNDKRTIENLPPHFGRL